jgi:calcineurin-like phosphoesterase family protein
MSSEMSKNDQLNALWQNSVRKHGLTHEKRGSRNRRIMNDKSIELLETLWSRPATTVPDFGAMIEAGKTVRWWSDPHFGHKRIIELCNRTEFSSVEDMDRVILANAVEAALVSDLVVCLGDYSLEEPWKAYKRLVALLGAKHLGFVGNHDAKGVAPAVWAAAGAQASAAFSLDVRLVRDLFAAGHTPDEVDLIDWRDLPKRVNFGVSHWPVPMESMPSRHWLNLHGHIHERQAQPLHMNCSVEAIGYRPKTLQELLTVELMLDFEAYWKGAGLGDGVGGAGTLAMATLATARNTERRETGVPCPRPKASGRSTNPAGTPS